MLSEYDIFRSYYSKFDRYSSKFDMRFSDITQDFNLRPLFLWTKIGRLELARRNENRHDIINRREVDISNTDNVSYHTIVISIRIRVYGSSRTTCINMYIRTLVLIPSSMLIYLKSYMLDYQRSELFNFCWTSKLLYLPIRDCRMQNHSMNDTSVCISFFTRCLVLLRNYHPYNYVGYLSREILCLDHIQAYHGSIWVLGEYLLRA